MHERLDPDEDFATPEWRRTVAFLWKVRAPQSELIRQWGAWNFVRPAPAAWALPAFAPQSDGLAQQIRQLLLPEKIEGVPLPVVVVVLSLFLLAVAPADYFLLGRLNCRKHTWWLFVVISATFTLCTVKIAESYMGHNDYRTALVIVDVDQRPGEAGPVATVARTNRFEMQFVAAQQKIEKTLRNCLYADLTDSAANQDKTHFLRRPLGLTDAEALDLDAPVASDLAVYEGALPSLFTVHQQLRQWSPRLSRQTSFTDDPALLAETSIDWKALTPAGLGSAEVREALFAKVLAGEPEAEVLLLNAGWAYDPAHNADAPQGMAADEAGIAFVDGAGRPIPVRQPAPPPQNSGQVCPAMQSASSVVRLAADASLRPATGMFAILSQIGPTGGEILEDLALYDQADPQQWLLIVAVRRDTTWIVYRRLFHGTSPTGGGS